MAGGMSKRQIASSVGIGPTAAGDYLRRAKLAGLVWPLPEALDDATLEARLFPPPQATAPAAGLAGDPSRPGVTLQLLWEEHRAARPNGYGRSRFCELHRE